MKRKFLLLITFILVRIVCYSQCCPLCYDEKATKDWCTTTFIAFDKTISIQLTPNPYFRLNQINAGNTKFYFTIAMNNTTCYIDSIKFPMNYQENLRMKVENILRNTRVVVIDSFAQKKLGQKKSYNIYPIKK